MYNPTNKQCDKFINKYKLYNNFIINIKIIKDKQYDKFIL